MRIKRKKGVTLLIVIVFMLVVVITIASFMHMWFSEISIARQQNNSTRAFYVAEGGLEDVIYKLKNEPDYRDNPTTVTGSIGGGDFSVGVIKNGDIYTLTSAGTLNNATRTITILVTLSPLWHDAFDYAIFGNSSNLELKTGTTVTGNVFQNGDIILRPYSTVSGYVDYTGMLEVGEGASYNTRPLPDPVPAFPALDLTYYSDEIATAASSGSGDKGYSSLDLSGGTLYVSGNLVINEGGNITGPGTLVVACDAELKTGVTVGEDITIITGKVMTMNSGCAINANSVIYAGEKVELKEANVIMARSTILTPGKVEFKMGGTFKGIIYAGAGITDDTGVGLKEHTNVIGCIVCGAGIQVKDGCSITYDPSQFAIDLPTGLQPAPEMEATVSNWGEST